MLGAQDWNSPALDAITYGTTSHERSGDRWHMLCDDGTRVVSQYNAVLVHWETTIMESPRQSCTGNMNSRTQRLEVRYR
jgi:hypothetical protein